MNTKQKNELSKCCNASLMADLDSSKSHYWSEIADAPQVCEICGQRQKKQTKTEAIILEMLLKNTGINMLDSGGDNGRAWQRNQLAGVQGITEAPAITFGYGSPVLSVYHFLTEHLEYAPMLDAAYSVWDETHSEDGWLETVDSFLDTLGVGQNGGFYESGRFTLNTYEMEYCYLAQVL